MPEKTIIEFLKRDFPEYHPLLTFRGTSALYLALCALKEERGIGEVIVPSLVCPSVVMAVLYAGLTPRFCDVEYDTMCISKDHLAEVINNETIAVIIVHLFGKCAFNEEILDLLNESNLMVIEDIAQAVGGTYNGRRLGEFGDFTVLSFHPTKIIDGAGGALLIKDTDYLESIERFSDMLPAIQRDKSFSESEKLQNTQLHGYYKLARESAFNKEPFDYANEIQDTRDIYLGRYLKDDESSKKTIVSYESLINSRSVRKDNYNEFIEKLPEEVEAVHFSDEEVPWRLPILLDNYNRQKLLIERIRGIGCLISNHYFPASYLFNDNSSPNSKDISLRIVNFWVDETIEREKISRICKEISSLFEDSEQNDVSSKTHRFGVN